MLVVDTSAVLNALVAEPRDVRLVERLFEGEELAAPHLLDVELSNALRGLARRSEISAERAADARLDFAELALTRYSHELLADRIWELRDNLTAYDAAFVSLAEALSCPLITSDAGLASSPAVRAEIVLYEPLG